jgi:limonene-1,2-epoxide hydrolase
VTPLETVNTFLAAAAKRDYDAALPLLTDDVEYHNMPIEPVHGRDAVKQQLEFLLSQTADSEWVVHREVASGDTVMNERTDRFLVNGTWIDLPVAGVFVVRGGGIAVWHDYFDLQTVMAALG